MASEKAIISIFTANSNSGKYCLDELLNKKNAELSNFRIRGVFRTEEKALPYKSKYPNLEIVYGCDASKPETLHKAFEGGVERALIVTPHDPKSGSFEQDADLTAQMIRHAVQHGVKYIVLVASFTVNFVQQMPILASRFLPSEQLLEKLSKEHKDLNWTVLRGGVFMENMLHQFKGINQENELFYPNVCIPPVYTKDIGRCAAILLVDANIDKHNAKHYEMNGPEMLTSEQMAAVFSKVLKKDIKYREMPADFVQKFPPALAQVYEHMILSGTNAAPFTDHVKKLTNDNAITLEQFIQDHLEYF
jgi:NAD(P)H dehydrogenase (quinone)